MLYFLHVDVLPTLPGPRATTSSLERLLACWGILRMLSWRYGTPRETSVILGLLLHMAQALQLNVIMSKNLMAYTSTGYIDAKEAVLSFLSCCLQYRSR